MKILIAYLLAAGVAVFLIYYLPFLAKDSKKITDSTEEIKKSLDILTKQNEELLELLKREKQK